MENTYKITANRAKYTLLNRIFNINSGEWPSVILCFFVRFLHKFGFVVGWTVIVAMLVTNYGIEFLPYLFVANGLFIMASGTLYYRLVRKFKNSVLIIGTVLVSCVTILLAMLLFQKITIFFFLVLVFAESFFLFQLNILLSAFIERFFTPLSSQRAFPFIESAETIAVIIAGIMIASLANVFATYKFFYIWIISIMLLIPAILCANVFVKCHVKEESPDVSECKSGFTNVLLDSIARVRRSRFLCMFIFIVLFQWIFANLMELQYTKAVSESLANNIDIPKILSSYEHALVHALGSLQILFGGSALLVQILIGSRIITSLGLVSSMILYPVIGFLSLFGLLFKFSFPTGVLARNNTEITNILFKNSYHSSFYVFPDKSRELSREFLEGFVRPFSTVIAMAIIVLLQVLFKGELLLLLTNILLFIVAVIMLASIISARDKYTEAAASVLFNEKSSLSEQLHAVFVLAQKGHNNVPSIFSKTLASPNISLKVKNEMIDVVGSVYKKELFPILLDTLESKNPDLVLSCLNTLSKYSDDEISGDFTKTRLVEILNSLFYEQKNLDVRKAVIHNISKFDSGDSAASFLVHALQTEDDPIKAEIILAMRKYSDCSVSHYIEPFLESPDPKLKVCACVSLWSFHKRRTEILPIVAKMFSGSKDCVLAAIFAVSEMGFTDYRKKLNHLMDDSDQDVSAYAAYALARLGYLDSCAYLADLLLYSDSVVSREIKKLVAFVPEKVLKHINRAMSHNVSHNLKYDVC